MRNRTGVDLGDRPRPDRGHRADRCPEDSGQLTPEQRAALLEQSVGFESGQGSQGHTDVGGCGRPLSSRPSLASTDRRIDLLPLAVGVDGHAAVVAHGDVSADFGNRGLLVALTGDGAALERLRLVVPGNFKGGRISDLVELRVVRLG